MAVVGPVDSCSTATAMTTRRPPPRPPRRTAAVRAYRVRAAPRRRARQARSWRAQAACSVRLPAHGPGRSRRRTCTHARRASTHPPGWRCCATAPGCRRRRVAPNSPAATPRCTAIVRVCADTAPPWRPRRNTGRSAAARPTGGTRRCRRPTSPPGSATCQSRPGAARASTPCRAAHGAPHAMLFRATCPVRSTRRPRTGRSGRSGRSACSHAIPNARAARRAGPNRRDS